MHTFLTAVLENVVRRHVADSSRVTRLFEFLSRPGVEDRYCTAPASSAVRFHHACNGGLLCHSVDVFLIGLGLWKKQAVPGVTCHMSVEDLLLASLLHDFNKIGDSSGVSLYVPNFLKNGKRSDALPYETNDGLRKWSSGRAHDTLIHSEAAYLVEHGWDFLPDGLCGLAVIAAIDCTFLDSIPQVVRDAILYHDGAYGQSRGRLAGKETPLQQVLHFSDMWSSRQHGQDASLNDVFNRHLWLFQ